MEIQVTIVDREGVAHKVMAPTDMNMTIMELIPIESVFMGDLTEDL